MPLDLLQVLTPLPAAAVAGASLPYALGLSSVFTIMFIMLGPIKLLAPYAQATAGLTPADARRLALKVAALATLSVVVGGFVGAGMLQQWNITTPVLEIAGGLIFLLVALNGVMQQYAPPSGAAPPAAAPPKAVTLVFPLVLTPYGIATVILLLSLSMDATRTLWLVAIVVAVMLLNLLAMAYAQAVMRRFAMPLRIFGAILGVLQVALALQIMVLGLRGLGVL
jgi:multiple antibiotic resistance protein